MGYGPRGQGLEARCAYTVDTQALRTVHVGCIQIRTITGINLADTPCSPRVERERKKKHDDSVVTFRFKGLPHSRIKVVKDKFNRHWPRCRI